VDGVLAVDLPVEESDEYRAALDAAGLESIFLAAPTTGTERLKRIGEASGGFIYYVCRRGVTGEQEELPAETGGRVDAIRRLTGKRIAVGFGISRREHVEQVASFADGVVIGSALVRVAEETGDRDDLVGRLGKKLRELFPAIPGG
jgi:tryptophan synthase alpha chain